MEHVAISVNVIHVDVADAGEGVVAEHGVDGLDELGATRLVDAACIRPHPLEPVFIGNAEKVADLW